jgi:signal transduction histidine kinase
VYISKHICNLNVNHLSFAVVGSFIQLQNELHESEKKFTRYISHEIRTPLNIVFMGLKLMEKELQDGTLTHAQAMTHVYDIRAAANAALTILNDMLMLYKVKQGLLVLEITEEDPYMVLKKTVNEFGIQVSLMLLRLLDHD